MSIETLTPADRIRAAVLYLTSLSPAFGERLHSAESLLLRGGWTKDGPAVHYPGGIVATETSCSCQEGSHIECLHKLGARALRIVDRFDRPAVGP